MAPSSFLLRLLLLPSTLLPVLASLIQTPQLPGLLFNLSTPRPADIVQSLPTVPDNCAKYTGAAKECPTTMSAVDVTYDDCGSPWTICRCASANITLDASVDFLAHVPVGLRRYVGTVMVMPDTSAHAYTLNSDIHFFGICSQRTWIHESTHAADGALGITRGGINGTPWAQAVGNDTCVPDTYAATNLVEDLAQMSVVEVYRLLNNTLPPGLSADCMSHQLAYLATLPLYNASTLFGDTCAFEPQLASALHDLVPVASSPTLQGSSSASQTPKPSGADGATRQIGFGVILSLLISFAV
ncbi:hypothetical protein C8F04DRAFT_597764 [Mycena alexandri]|uniref:Uncharacterized protein n=1 Tax=Mycena alexandri TaxID=1745969 RepID=A0AAD6XA55_9AGAR|nr:hypothetical protein C8F04DRAFT_597764 [Mycena alexandri]